MQNLCDEQFKQGHLMSALAYISSRCEFFEYSQHLDMIVSGMTQQLKLTSVPQDTISQISQNIVNAQVNAKILKQEIQIAQHQQHNVVFNLIQCNNDLKYTQNYLQNQNDTRVLLNKVKECFEQVLKLKQAIDYHSEQVKQIDTAIMDVEQNKTENVLDVINNSHQQIKRLQSMKEVILGINSVENQLDGLRNHQIIVQHGLVLQIQQLKQKAYYDIIVKTAENWVMYLKTIVQQIGKIQQESDFHQTKNQIDFESIRVRTLQFLKEFEVQSCQNLKIKYDKDYLYIRNSLPKSNQLLTTHRALFDEIIGSASSLGFEKDIIFLIQQRWDRNLPHQLSIEQLVFQQKFSNYESIIGIILVQNEIPQIIQTKRMVEYFETLSESINNFTKQVKQLPQQHQKRLRELAKQYNIEQYFQFHSNIYHHFDFFLEFLMTTQMKDVIQQHVVEFLKAFFDFFVRDFAKYFAYNEIFNQISETLSKISTYDQNKVHYEIVFQTARTIEKLQRLYQFLNNYINYQVSLPLPLYSSLLNSQYLVKSNTITLTDTQISLTFQEAFVAIFLIGLENVVSDQSTFNDFVNGVQLGFTLVKGGQLLCTQISHGLQTELRKFNVAMGTYESNFIENYEIHFATILRSEIQRYFDATTDFCQRYQGNKKFQQSLGVQQYYEQLAGKLQFLPQEKHRIVFEFLIKLLMWKGIILKILQQPSPFIINSSSNLLIDDLKSIATLNAKKSIEVIKNSKFLSEIVTLHSEFAEVQSISKNQTEITQRQASLIQQLDLMLRVSQPIKCCQKESGNVKDILKQFTQMQIVTMQVCDAVGCVYFNQNMISSIDEQAASVVQKLKVSSNEEKKQVQSILKNVKKQ